jgi:hypothetical protein
MSFRFVCVYYNYQPGTSECSQLLTHLETQVTQDYILVINREGKENIHLKQHMPVRFDSFDINGIKIKTLVYPEFEKSNREIFMSYYNIMLFSVSRMREIESRNFCKAFITYLLVLNRCFDLRFEIQVV